MSKYDFKYADIEIRNKSFKIRWGVNNFGFGEFYFQINDDSTTEMHTECMSDEFVKELFGYLLSNTKRID